MKYQDIENEIEGFEMHQPGCDVANYDYNNTCKCKPIKQFFKTKMKEAMMEIIGSEELERTDEQIKSLNESPFSTWAGYHNGYKLSKREVKQRANEFFEEKGGTK